MQRRRTLKCDRDTRRFTVVRVNGDPRDTHAGRSFEQALRLAQPDRGSRIDVYAVCSKDAGAARFEPLRRGEKLRTFRFKGR